MAQHKTAERQLPSGMSYTAQFVFAAVTVMKVSPYVADFILAFKQCLEGY